MRLIGTPLAVEVHVRVSSRRWRIIPAIAPAHALHRRPRLDQRSIDAEVLRGQKTLAPGSPADAPQQLARHPGLDQSVAVLGEGRMVPNPIIHRQPHEPAKQQVVVQLLAQQSLGADRVQHLQYQSPHQALRRNRFTTAFGVNPIKVCAHRLKRLVQQRAHPAQRMRARHPLLYRDVAEEPTLLNIRSAHVVLSSLNRVVRTVTYARQISTAC
jgi:hypothetical protein